MTDSNQDESETKISMIPIEKLFISRANIRTLQIEAEALIPSIMKDGISKPLDVYSSGNMLAIMDGQRRFLAVIRILEQHPELRKRLGRLPCIIRPGIDDEKAVEFSLKEFMHRKDVCDLDKARAIRKLRETHGTLEKMSKETGIPVSTLSQLDSLNDLDPPVQEMMNFQVGKTHLSLGKAIEVAKLPRLKQLEVAQRVQSCTTEEARRIIRAERTGQLSPVEKRIPLIIMLLPQALSALESLSVVRDIRKEDYIQTIVVQDLRKQGYLDSNTNDTGGQTK